MKPTKEMEQFKRDLLQVQTWEDYIGIRNAAIAAYLKRRGMYEAWHAAGEPKHGSMYAIAAAVLANHVKKAKALRPDFPVATVTDTTDHVWKQIKRFGDNDAEFRAEAKKKLFKLHQDYCTDLKYREEVAKFVANPPC